VGGAIEIVVGCIFPLILGVLPAIREDFPTSKAWFAFEFAFALFIWSAFIFTSNDLDNVASFTLTTWLRLLAIAFVLMLISFGCDMGFIILTRRALQVASSTSDSLKIVGSMMLNYFAAWLLVAMPFYRLVLRPQFHGTLYSEGSKWFYLTWYDIADGVVYSNLLGGMVASVFILCGLIMLLHRFVWPLVERPIYALGNLGIARRRKVLATLGVLLISVAFGNPVEWLAKLIEAAV
jgi:hypothetical protein